MGFWDALGKVVDKSCDIMTELARTNARNIDRMSDEEIEKRHFKSAKMIRRDAVEMSDAELGRKYSRTADEVRRDAVEMNDEELERKYSISADEVRRNADTILFQAEMYQMKREQNEMKRLQAEGLQKREAQRGEFNEMDEFGEYDDEFGE
ncbi:MAG: hypothetical protein HDR17_02525 [Lachnospiraceae bacterium]|nr:hypothetical protein [Lachnospiraceae bacterium]